MLDVKPEHAQSLPPAAQMMQMITGRWLSQAIRVAAELGVADNTHDALRPVSEVAAAVGAHPDALYRLVRALSSVGIFTLTLDRQMALTPLARTLRSDAPDSVRPMGIFFGSEEHWRAHQAMGYSVRTGQNAFEKVYGQKPWEYIETHPQMAAVFDAAMTSFTRQVIGPLLVAYDFAGVNKMVDVAGGQGLLLGSILQKYPHMQGVVFDLPHVGDGCRANLQSMGVQDRCSFEAGSMFERVPGGGDIYSLKHILHDWDDASCVKILQNIRAAMAPGGRVLILEQLIPTTPEPHMAKFLDLEMLVLTSGGRERIAEEYADLLTKAGFKLERVVPTVSPVAIVVGITSA